MKVLEEMREQYDKTTPSLPLNLIVFIIIG
ncbi:hypothetical protein ABIE50_004080 [Chitinophaga sp. OAE865]